MVDLWWSIVLRRDPVLAWLHEVPQKERERLSNHLMAQIAPGKLLEIFAKRTEERAEIPVDEQLSLAGRPIRVVNRLLENSVALRLFLTKKSFLKQLFSMLWQAAIAGLALYGAWRLLEP